MTDTPNGARNGKGHAAPPPAPAAESPRDRAGLVRAAIETWKNQLIDLSGRNNLLFFRDQRTGTLDLTHADTAALDALLLGQTVTLTQLFPSPAADGSAVAAGPAGPDGPAGPAGAAGTPGAAGKATVPNVRADAVRRMRRMHARARENFEEQGVDSLFIGAGLATWASDRTASTPNAPVLLRPLSAVPRGVGQTDFELTLVGDAELNPTLVRVFGAEFGQALDQEALQDRYDGIVDTRAEIEATWSWLTAGAPAVPGLAVAPRFVVGNFAYAKLPMVQDLEASEEALIDHDIVAALAGDGPTRHRLQDRYRSIHVSAADPDKLDPDKEFLVVDADASQNLAIDDVLAGQDLIVKGPPGTGKSQTIANLISTALGQGKTVLFVAEKRAAIDAVFKRLHAVGLDDLLLDLHDTDLTRRKVAQTLKKSLDLVGTEPPRPHGDQSDRLVRARAAVDDFVVAAHRPRLPWQASAYDARLRCHAATPAQRTDFRLHEPALAALDAQHYAEARRHMQSLAEVQAFETETLDSPWQRLADVTPEHCQTAFETAQRLRAQTLPQCLDKLKRAATETGLPPATSIAGWKAYMEAWRGARLALGVFGDRAFGTVPEALADAAKSASRGSRGRPDRLPQGWAKQFPALFPGSRADGSVAARPDLLDAFAPARHSWSRLRAGLFSGRYRDARKQVRALLRSELTGDADAYRALASAVQAAALWLAADGDGLPRPPALLDERVEPAFERLMTDIEALRAELSTDPSSDDIETVAVADRLDRLIADRHILLKLQQIRRHWAALENAGLAPLLAEMAGARVPPTVPVARLDYVWYRSIVDEVEFSDVQLASFDPQTQTAAVAEFRAADRDHLAETANRVRSAYARRARAVLDQYGDEADLIVHQAALKAGHLPLRRLVSKAPNALMALKPCWAMSPLMVSQLMPADRRYFDLVVFDEASQILPADAVPAILRGRQVVVAGDDRQLPPTTFFDSQSLDEDVDPDELAEQLAATSGFESILDALGPLLPTSMLRWHYRSRDERLIAFSNYHFYDGELVTFPGASSADCLEHVLVPFRPLADQEKSSSDEVAEVVRLILAHASTRPTESLGVIALGITHANRISDALNEALRTRHDLDAFFSEKAPAGASAAATAAAPAAADEPFFVKNLERVQGDEREAIILSIGYGKAPDGRLFYRFGPLNVEGGERRLNVAITRARRRLTVVSSFSAKDMDPRRVLSNGARLLQSYLDYAAHHGDATLGAAGLRTQQLPAAPADPAAGAGAGDATDVPPITPFEAEIGEALSAAGLDVVSQLGASADPLDFAIRHPRRPDRFVLAAELDGPDYAAAPTARDRDRLRQDQLERLGWRFHRIWAGSWIDDPAAETARIRAAYEQAIAFADAPPPPPVAPVPQPPEPVPPAPRPPRVDPLGPHASPPEDPPHSRPGPRPEVGPNRPVGSYKAGQLMALVDWLESDGQARSDAETVADMRRELGSVRRSRGDRDVILEAARAARERRRDPRARLWRRVDRLAWRNVGRTLEQQAWQAKYGSMAAAAESMIADADPHRHFWTGSDQYYRHMTRILPRLEQAQSAVEVLAIVRAELAESPDSDWLKLANGLWQLQVEWKSKGMTAEATERNEAARRWREILVPPQAPGSGTEPA